MPRIFDNIELELLPALKQTLNISEHADFCVGYFNLRGWKAIDGLVENWSGGTDKQCRLIVGMQRLPREELLSTYSLLTHDDQMSNKLVIDMKRRLAQEFREQLTYGVPNDADEAGLRKLSAQLKSGKVVVKLFLSHALHAKLYLCFRSDPNNPITGFLGSSNLTFSGLSTQGELNVDVLDHDATQKLAKWFNDRWEDKWCVDITKELIQTIDESWARADCPPPYQIYVNMAYHLAEEARAGLSEFNIPADMRSVLLEFQSAAVRIAARHLEKRGGVILGDVVGLGKTIMATALARMFQDPPHCLETLILCPKNLVGMWEDYAAKYRLLAKVVSVTQAQNVLPDLRRYRIVIVDESHNLRNREGHRWRIIRDYVSRNACKCILLSATPYNKTFLDLSNQLHLFLAPDDSIGIRPEAYIRNICEGRPEEFTRRHQCSLNCLAAFEKSNYADDWREVMRLFMVRRTRSFVEKNYAFTECPECHTVLLATQTVCPKCSRPKAKPDRRFLVLDGNKRFSFPKRKPKALCFQIDDNNPQDQYAKLYSDPVVNKIKRLHLSRYGLGNYINGKPSTPPVGKEIQTIENLSRAGTRLIGFCRTNMYKRLESSGYAFLVSIRRHILRNCIMIHALENNLAIPIGTQDFSLFDTLRNDNGNDDEEDQSFIITAKTGDDFAKTAAAGYNLLATEHAKDFSWLRSDLFISAFAEELREDVKHLLSILELSGDWKPEKDEKLLVLHKLLTQQHPNQKVIIFSQFADTINYLRDQLQTLGLTHFAAVTGQTEYPSEFAKRFSPVSNDFRNRVSAENELRVLIATDVLSEGQNLQDAAIIVNFDLPWAIIRLIQRAGRVDRIGQKSEEILCYSFIPADGVERVIRLRARVRQRLQENAEVVGTDETFFEDEQHDNFVHDLFTEKSDVLDDPEDDEVDLSSLAYQIWKNACDEDPKLRKIIPEFPNVIYSTKSDKTQTGMSVPQCDTGIPACASNTDIPVCEINTLSSPPSTVFSSLKISCAHRNLPHWTAEHAIYWITFRLADSLPQEKLAIWREERDVWLNANSEPWDVRQWTEYNEKFGERFQTWLDAGYGSCSLVDPVVRTDVSKCLTRFDGARYDLISAVIMPNHVHMLLLPRDGENLSVILKGMKGASARAANKILSSAGTFWMDESYDRIVRSQKELDHFLKYIRENPERANLVEKQYWLWNAQAGMPVPQSDTDIPVCSSTTDIPVCSNAPSKPHLTSGVMVYLRTSDGSDALAWVDENGKIVTESQHEILRAAACKPTCPTLPRLDTHHKLVEQAVLGIQTEIHTTGGQLGRPGSARRRVYEHLKDYASQIKETLFDIKPLHLAIDAIYAAPLTEAARDLLNREMKSGADKEKLADLVISLYEEDRLCVPQDDLESREPKIICSLGIRKD